MSEHERTLTRQQVEHWRESWSWDDQHSIIHNLDRFEAKGFTVIESGGYVKCLDAIGQVVMNVGAGWFQTLHEILPTEVNPHKWDFHALSIFSFHPGSEAIPELRGGVCQIHWIERSLDGTCDACDEGR